ncbi:MAG: RNA polymerase sigma factor [Chloroflexota bacterium]
MTTSETEYSSERELVEAAKTSREAFGELYDRYVVRIYRYAYRRTGSHHDAEELTSETFRRAMEHMGRYRWDDVPFGAWIHRIAANLVIDRFRRERAMEPLEEALESADGDPQPEQAVLDAEEARHLWALVDSLQPDQRRAVVLRFSHGLSGREIAERMGRSEAAVKQLLYRAMLALRERVRAGDYDRQT